MTRAGGSAYPHLAPELQRLQGDALILWGDADARRDAFEDLLDAWEAGSPHLRRAVGRIDAAVVQGLAQLGLPRGDLLGQVHIVDTTLYEPAGQKLADCRLHLSGTIMAHSVRALGHPDDSFRTWAHESIHARQPYAFDAASEHRPFKGYEEGLAEGLAGIAVREKAGMRPFAGSYVYYVQVYRSLAGVLGISPEQLWQELWHAPVGRVRENFAATASRLGTSRAQPLTTAQQARVRALADTFFATSRMNQWPDEVRLAEAWRAALP